MMPFFSVIIPTYNRTQSLIQAVKSVLKQSCGDFEILVMDDGSTDSSAADIALLNDARIRYSWDINSGGPATPRNRGLGLSRGEWACFLDADDVWYPDKLESVKCEITRRPDVDVVCHWEMERVIGRRHMRLLRHGPYEPEFYKKLLMGGNRISTSATCIKRNFLNAFDLRFNESPQYVIVEDYDFWMNVARAGAKFTFIEKPLGEYVLSGGNISSNRDKYLNNLEVMLRNQVFNVQSFADPEVLWNTIRAHLDLSRVRSDIAAGQFYKGVSRAVKLGLRHPGILATTVLARVRSATVLWH